jgi:hypothetical protein
VETVRQNVCCYAFRRLKELFKSALFEEEHIAQNEQAPLITKHIQCA